MEYRVNRSTDRNRKINKKLGRVEKANKIVRKKRVGVEVGRKKVQRARVKKGNRVKRERLERYEQNYNVVSVKRCVILPLKIACMSISLYYHL